MRLDAARSDGTVLMSTLGIGVLALALPFLDFAPLGGSSFVRPLVLPLAVALLTVRLATTPRMKLRLDAVMWLALAFCFWCVVGSIVMPTVVGAPTELKGLRLDSRILRDLLALGLGFVFWLAVRFELSRPAAIGTAVRMMLVSYWLTLAACTVQILVLFDVGFARSVDEVMAFIRAHQTGEGEDFGKIFGLAPEGSMLADQLATIYFPFLLASLAEKQSFFRKSGVRMERIMFGLAFMILVFSQSRIGFIALLGLVCAFYFLNLQLRGNNRSGFPVSGILFLGAALALVAYFGAERFSLFLGSFAGVDESVDSGIWSNVTRLGSMLAGFWMFVAHPMGVGTGAFPFLFAEFVPNWAMASPEVQALLGLDYGGIYAMGDMAQRLPDAKAIPMRLLAETGLPGFLLVATGWFIQVRGCWRIARRTTVPFERMCAFGCVLSMVVMVPMAFNINSYIWVHWLFVSAIATSLMWEYGRARAAPAQAVAAMPA